MKPAFIARVLAFGVQSSFAADAQRRTDEGLRTTPSYNNAKRTTTRAALHAELPTRDGFSNR